MIGWVATRLIGWGVKEKFARPLAILALAVAVIAAAAGVKACYDSNLIEKHDAERRADTAEADRAADNNAADQRRTDDRRVIQEKEEIDDAIETARREGRDPRAAYYACIELQQSARARGEPSPGC